MDTTTKAYAATIDFVRALMKFPVYFLCLYIAIDQYAPQDWNWVAYIFLAVFIGSTIQFCWDLAKAKYKISRNEQSFKDITIENYTKLSKDARKALAYCLLVKRYKIYTNAKYQYLGFYTLGDLLVFRFCIQYHNSYVFNTKEFKLIKDVYYDELKEEFLEELKKEHPKDIQI
jgi:hypothetical protein